MSANVPGLLDRAEERQRYGRRRRGARGSPRPRRGTRVSSSRVSIGRHLVGLLLHLDHEPTLRVGLGGSGNAAVQSVQRHGGRRRPGSRTRSVTSATVPTFAYSPLVLRHEQHALLVADLDGQRHVHVGEDDDVVERDEQQLAHRSGHAPRIWFESSCSHIPVLTTKSVPLFPDARPARGVARPTI